MSNSKIAEALGVDLSEVSKLDPGTALLAKLAEASGLVDKPITGDAVEYHDGSKIVLPRGMGFAKAYKVLKRLEEEAETPTDFRKFFKYRADDGAYAALMVIKRRYGMLLGKELDMGFFGKLNAQTREIKVGVGQTMQVPWGLIEIPSCPGLELQLAEANHRENGRVFAIQGSGPKKYREEFEELVAEIEEFLKQNSIYRGRALIGAEELDFLDLDSFDANQIVFADDVQHVLEGTVWAPLRYTDTMRRERVPLKRCILLHGPYGTGKTSVGQLTALYATTNGWTFISARPGRDKVEDVLRTARLYQPAVVFVEDIDVSTAPSGDNEEVSKFLDAFDGITAKGGELIAVMTTNHLDRIHKGMLRPGRLDAVVEIGALDRNGTERLVKAIVPASKLDPEIDYDAVYESMEGFFPAFIRESLTRSVTFAIHRNEGSQDYVIGTDDLVGAALSLRPQLEALNSANEGVVRPSLDVAIEDVVRGAVVDMRLRDNYGDNVLRIVADKGEDN